MYNRCTPKTPLKDMMDPLRLLKGMEEPIIFSKMIRDIENRKAYIPGTTSIAVYLYWMAKFDINSDYIVNTTLGELDLIRGKFDTREAFGFYFGALSLSLPKNILMIAREEYSRIAQNNKSGDITRSL